MSDLVSRLKVDRNTSVHDALARLNRGGHRLLLLVNENGALIRTITDGDIRRFLLAGAQMHDPLSGLPALQPKTAPLGVTAERAMQIMVALSIDHLPVVDEAGCPVGIFDRRELDSEILLSVPHLSKYELDYVEEAFSNNWIAPIGPNVDAFEKELAEHVGVGYAAAVSSGTAAIHLALLLLGVQSGDRVFCSALTFVATANPILYQGGTPVFIDSEPATWNMSPVALEKALADAARSNRLPKAVIVVNLYGQSADMDAINALCGRYDVPVIEDAAESLGATYRNRASGTLGKLGIYSFNGNKIITTSGGGMLVASDEALVSRARFLATQARDHAPYYQHSVVGYNYRMSNILAGIGRGQLRVLGQRVASRRAIYQRYADALRDIPGVSWMPEADFGCPTRWLSVMTIAPQRGLCGPDRLIAELAGKRIEARHTWKPLHRQPLFAGCEYYPYAPDRSVSDEIFRDGICLPSSSSMTEGQQTRVIESIRQVLQSGHGSCH